MAKNGSYSYNATGHQDPDTGEVKDLHGKVVPIGLDEDAKKSLQEQIDGPKARVMPSALDLLVGNTGFTTVPRPITYADSVSTGGKEDVAAATGDTTVKTDKK